MERPAALVGNSWIAGSRVGNARIPVLTPTAPVPAIDGPAVSNSAGVLPPLGECMGRVKSFMIGRVLAIGPERI